MNTVHRTEISPSVGDHVVVRGTRIVGDVAHVDGQAQISVKVTEVLGKKTSSKTARAWRGAWLTCAPTMVAPIAPISN